MLNINHDYIKSFFTISLLDLLTRAAPKYLFPKNVSLLVENILYRVILKVFRFISQLLIGHSLASEVLTVRFVKTLMKSVNHWEQLLKAAENESTHQLFGNSSDISLLDSNSSRNFEKPLLLDSSTFVILISSGVSSTINTLVNMAIYDGEYISFLLLLYGMVYYRENVIFLAKQALGFLVIGLSYESIEYTYCRRNELEIHKIRNTKTDIMEFWIENSGLHGYMPLPCTFKNERLFRSNLLIFQIFLSILFTTSFMKLSYERWLINCGLFVIPTLLLSWMNYTFVNQVSTADVYVFCLLLSLHYDHLKDLLLFSLEKMKIIFSGTVVFIPVFGIRLLAALVFAPMFIIARTFQAISRFLSSDHHKSCTVFIAFYLCKILLKLPETIRSSDISNVVTKPADSFISLWAFCVVIQVLSDQILESVTNYLDLPNDETGSIAIRSFFILICAGIPLGSIPDDDKAKRLLLLSALILLQRIHSNISSVLTCASLPNPEILERCFNLLLAIMTLVSWCTFKHSYHSFASGRLLCRSWLSLILYDLLFGFAMHIATTFLLMSDQSWTDASKHLILIRGLVKMSTGATLFLTGVSQIGWKACRFEVLIFGRFYICQCLQSGLSDILSHELHDMLTDLTKCCTITGWELNLEPIECSICLTDIEIPTKTSCNHVFHSDCLRAWLQTGQNSCPNCRSVITSDYCESIISCVQFVNEFQDLNIQIAEYFYELHQVPIQRMNFISLCLPSAPDIFDWNSITLMRDREVGEMIKHASYELAMILVVYLYFCHSTSKFHLTGSELVLVYVMVLLCNMILEEDMEI